MSAEAFMSGRIGLCCGDAIHFVRDQPANRYDSIVTDPPYALVSIVKRFANSPRSERTENTENPYGRTGRGFMGQRWDTGETAFSVEFWRECLRVLKPGGHVVAFSGTRTYHRLACAIEDAGFEIRDMIGWIYGSGFPKSHDVSKGLARELAGPALREQWKGWGTALKPSQEPICFARKPLVGTVAQNVVEHGTGAINIDGCRVTVEDESYARNCSGDRGHADNRGRDMAFGMTAGSASKIGRWPANLVHDGSEEVLAAFPEGRSAGDYPSDSWGTGNGITYAGKKPQGALYDDSGSAARFFYTAKADANDRVGSKHPTVKPVDLMQWLVRLVTPKGGLVLDPFAGTGTTAEACFREGMRCMLVEREADYQADIRRRMALILAGPDERARESIKAKLADQPLNHGPLFESLMEAKT